MKRRNNKLLTLMLAGLLCAATAGTVAASLPVKASADTTAKSYELTKVFNSNNTSSTIAGKDGKTELTMGNGHSVEFNRNLAIQWFNAKDTPEYTTLKFTVTDQNGNYVTADDGTKLDGTQPANVAYTFTIDKFGTYEVAYEAYDSALALAPYSYVIHSVDTQSPTIRLENMVTTGKVGEAISLANYEVDDNLGKEGLSVFVSVIYPNGTVKAVNAKAFTAQVAGRYTVQYLVFDVEGNIAYASYEVVVS